MFNGGGGEWENEYSTRFWSNSKGNSGPIGQMGCGANPTNSTMSISPLLSVNYTVWASELTSKLVASTFFSCEYRHTSLDNRLLEVLNLTAPKEITDAQNYQH
jgi:hypothetical protein